MCCITRLILLKCEKQLKETWFNGWWQGGPVGTHQSFLGGWLPDGHSNGPEAVLNLNLILFTPPPVRLAAQVLSHSVAAGISTLCVSKVLPEESLHTAECIERMDQLFNSFISATISSCSNSKMRRPFSVLSDFKPIIFFFLTITPA